MRGQLLRVRPPVRLTRLLWSSAAYFVPQQTGDVLVGATMEEVGFDERTTIEGVNGLMAAAREVFPGWATCELIEARAGLRPATPDNLPLVGPSRIGPSVVYAAGHFRNGIILAPWTADLVAGLILDGDADSALASLSPARFGL